MYKIDSKYLVKPGTRITRPCKKGFCKHCANQCKDDYCRPSDNACDKVLVCMAFFLKSSK